VPQIPDWEPKKIFENLSFQPQYLLALPTALPMIVKKSSAVSFIL
jgi:hypothetical protein